MEGWKWIIKERIGWTVLLTVLLVALFQMTANMDSTCDCNLQAQESVEKGNISIAVGAEDLDSVEAEPTLRGVNYLRDPMGMVSAFDGCLKDRHCRFVYHHAYKTGGTSIEAQFEKICSQRHEYTCCDEKLVNKFRSRKSYFCMAKFSSWQVHSDEFWWIVDQCSQMLLKNTSNPSFNSTRWVIFTTFRDPIEMLVSHINQRCNKNHNRRSPQFLEACMACNYSSHPQIWDAYAEEVNRQVSSIYNVTTLRSKSLSTLDLDRLQVFTWQPSELDVFFRQWHPPN